MKKFLGMAALMFLMVITASSLDASDGKRNTAVVCFSPTGTTMGVAKMITAAAGADLYEIAPEDKYSAADLNYNNDNCRANIEMRDSSARPAIASDLSAVQGHDVIFIGYPIWWGTAPRIINTFIETYDLKGAEIYLFCTSGSSSISTSISDLRTAYPSLDIKDGRRLNGASAAQIGEWMGSIGAAKGD